MACSWLTKPKVFSLAPSRRLRVGSWPPNWAFWSQLGMCLHRQLQSERWPSRLGSSFLASNIFWKAGSSDFRFSKLGLSFHSICLICPLISFSFTPCPYRPVPPFDSKTWRAPFLFIASPFLALRFSAWFKLKVFMREYDSLSLGLYWYPHLTRLQPVYLLTWLLSKLVLPP